VQDLFVYVGNKCREIKMFSKVWLLHLLHGIFVGCTRQLSEINRVLK